MSNGKIALVLGDGLSRGAVNCKAHALGLPSRKTGPRGPRHVRTKKAQGAISGIVHRVKREARKQPNEVTAPPAELPSDAIPIEQRKQLVDLELGHCRYPYGTPGADDFFFCGDTTLETKSYCAFHFRWCYLGKAGASTAERQRARMAARKAAQDAGTTARIF
jgi:GcrA cell cycle regulator